MAVSDIINDARKIAYLTYLYPKKSMQEILDMLFMPGISKDVAVWAAQDQGWIEVSKKGGAIKLAEGIEVPEPIEDEIMHSIKERIVAAVKHQNRVEEDIDEVMFLKWMAGWPSHDILIVINLMLKNEELAIYTIAEGKKHENVYTFYTMPENLGKEWGKKRFKDKSNLLVGDKNQLDI